MTAAVFWAQSICQGSDKSSQQSYMVGTIIPILQMRKLRLMEVKFLPQSHQIEIELSPEPFSPELFSLHLHCSKCNLQTSEIIRNTQSQAPYKTKRIKIYI